MENFGLKAGTLRWGINTLHRIEGSVIEVGEGRVGADVWGR